MEENKKNPFIRIMEIIAAIIIIISFIVGFGVITLLDWKEGLIELVSFILLCIVFLPVYSKLWKERINKYHKTLMNFEGNNKSYNDIEKLLSLVDEHNRTRPGVGMKQWPKIYLPEINSTEEIKEDKKYTVEIKKYDTGYISRIIIIEQNNEK